MVHHRHKQRALTAILLAIGLVAAADTYVVLNPLWGPGFTLLFSLVVATVVVTAFETYNRTHCHERATLHGALTQVYLGTVVIAAGIVTLFVWAAYPIELAHAYLLFSALLLIILLASVKHFRIALAKEVDVEFPIKGMPKPGDTPQDVPVPGKTAKAVLPVASKNASATPVKKPVKPVKNAKRR
jgi:hypothetical protein